MVDRIFLNKTLLSVFLRWLEHKNCASCILGVVKAKGKLKLPCRAVWENFLLVEQMSHFNTYETNKHSNAKYFEAKKHRFNIVLVHLYLLSHIFL